jgi:hypothetical protein
MIYRLLCGALIAPFLVTVASAAGTRVVTVYNESPALIDAGFLQPPSATTLSIYGTLHPNGKLSFKLGDGDAKIAVKSGACHGSSYALVPARATSVTVEKDCKLFVR